ncbi:MAG: hypothetical protein JNG84_12155 [Archangium sp.]|nr:hypothetical protein [Archangium sp.]
MADEVPYWVLISVLFSSFPMTQRLAMAIHRVAFELHTHGQSVGLVEDGLAQGQVRRVGTEAAIGTITGPVFEAELETERGKGEVRFLLTRQGLELMEAQRDAAPPTPRGLMN